MQNHLRKTICIISLIATSAILIFAIIISTNILISQPTPASPPDDNTVSSHPNFHLPDISDLPGKDPDQDSDSDSPHYTTTFINLQPIVNQWLTSLTPREEVGLMIYDITNDQTAASFHADEIFSVASIYKLSFVYDGYAQITRGLDDGDKFYTRTAAKGDLTLSKCLDLMIRESYNGCADKIASESSRIKRVNAFFSQLGLSNTTNIGLSSTAADLTKILRAIWQHSELSPELWNQFADSMLNQPPSLGEGDEIYNWRQGLPAGFSNQVDVYNKVGWEWGDNKWNIYCDTAIIDFPELGRTYTVAVLTRNFFSTQKISQLGTLLENIITQDSIDYNIN